MTMREYLHRGLVAFFVLIAVTLGNIFSLYTADAHMGADCIVVFGAAVWPGEFGPVASHALRDRALAGAELYKRGVSSCIILSGANSVYGAHEVDIMTDILLREGVPVTSIELDREGINTFETLAHLSRDKTYILVSNDFHLARIGLLASRRDLHFTLHSASYSMGGRYAREPFFVFREAVAWWYYFFATLF